MGEETTSGQTTLTPQKPTIGRLVHYKLSAEDVERINRRREGFFKDKWPKTAQRHVGNEAKEGDVLPMLIVRVLSEAVNGQIFLDGNDVLWGTRPHGQENGQWDWPAA